MVAGDMRGRQQRETRARRAVSGRKLPDVGEPATKMTQCCRSRSLVAAPSWLLSQIADCPGRTASRRDVPFRTRSGPARDVALPQLGNDNVNIKHCREVSRIG